MAVNLKSECEWTDVEWLRDRMNSVMEFYGTMQLVPQPGRRNMAVKMLGEGRLLDRVYGMGLTPVAKRLLRRVRG
jgi:hypothetical protein